ncbi:hypothetical protein D1610_01795 [Sphingomonas gilva]|uniref:Uncharacterized protein n=1 Tax=Sphingomonas gilva TaxID=2305907 RepID=A0A396RQW1_9SPHN|nr:hypothetical protein D1610_01795 [Sphingomonas gilva]
MPGRQSDPTLASGGIRHAGSATNPEAPAFSRRLKSIPSACLAGSRRAGRRKAGTQLKQQSYS